MGDTIVQKTPLDKEWYFVDRDLNLHCCYVKPFYQTEQERTDVKRTGIEWRNFAQVDCDIGGEKSVPVGLITKDEDRYYFHAYSNRYNQIAEGGNDIDLRADFHKITKDFSYYNFDNERYEDFVLDAKALLRGRFNRSTRKFRKVLPESHAGIGASTSAVFTDDGTIFNAGPMAELTLFPLNPALGLKFRYRHEFGIENYLTDDTTASWSHVDTIATIGLSRPRYPLRLELDLGIDWDFTTGDWQEDTVLRAGTNHEVGPFNYYGLTLLARAENGWGASFNLGTGPARIDRGTPSGRVEDDYWSFVGGLTLSYSPSVAYTQYVEREVEFPICKDSKFSDTELPRFENPYPTKAEPAPPPEPVKKPADPGELLRKRLAPLEEVKQNPQAGAQECRLVEKIELDVKFEEGSAKLTQRSLGSVATLGTIIKDATKDMREIGHTIERMEVHGYTDSKGDEDFNLELSQQRAASVVVELREKGIDIPMDAIGHGEEPKYLKRNSDGSEDQAASRRVEILFILDSSWTPTETQRQQ
jgi:outer membrane protein OmpA-like peptidoglycan-associated protein